LPPLRETVKGFLKEREYDSILALLGREKRLVRTAVSLLYDGDELTRWRAVTFMGRLAQAEPDRVRPLLKRFIWWMNDESGGIGWGSAPAMGEIGRVVPELMKDAVRVVVHFRLERFLYPGVIWATGRLAETFPEVVAEVVPDLVNFLGEEDAVIRGQAVLALGEIGDGRAREGLEGMLGDTSAVNLYENEKLETKEVKTAAAEALVKLSGGIKYREGH
jgi:HEAT repeat protein